MIRSCAIAALAVIAFAAPGHAFMYQSTNRVIVSYADLDVSHDAGAQMLLMRLRSASTAVCGGRPDMRDLARSSAYGACFAQAMDDAVRQTHLPQVASAYGKPELVADAHRTQMVAVESVHSR